jgi:hypothetical protein
MTGSTRAPADAHADAAAGASQQAHLAWLHQRGMAALLALLVFVVFLLPTLMSYGDAWHVVSDGAILLILTSGIVAVVEHRRLALALAAVSLLVLALRMVEWFTPVSLLPELHRVSTLGAFALLAIAVAANVFAGRHAVGDRLFGAIVLYLLLGLMWGVLYSALEAHSPDAFSGHPGTAGTLTDWVYFSFVTLTTVGYGDITPVATSARSLAMLEALTGQLYPAIIIARLVSLPAGTTQG